jgi:hypothetical protein
MQNAQQTQDTTSRTLKAVMVKMGKRQKICMEKEQKQPPCKCRHEAFPKPKGEKRKER